MNQRATTRSSDATLVAACLRGDRASFVEIVERHQALVCAVAYQGTGDFAAAEDVAQDTFVTAWKKLATLREPDKLRAWLTRIAGTLAVDWLRKNGPRRLSAAGPDLSHLPDAAPTPDAAAVSREEAAIVWQALEALPEASRLPLILFYREGQSIARVAAALEISDDAVKQRLSRGREALRDRLAGIAESVLQRTQPGAIFTFAVMAAIGALAAPAAVAATAFTAGSAAPVAATATGAKSLTTASAVMTATQVSIAAALAFLLPAAWPLTAITSGKETQAAAQSLLPSHPSTASATKENTAPAPLESRDLRLSRLESLLDQLQGDSRGLTAAMVNLECRHFIMSLPLELMQPALDLMDARRRKHTSSPMAATLFERWAQLDPHSAYAAAMEIQPSREESNNEQPRLRQECLAGLASEWTRLDRTAALAFFRIMPEDLRSSAIMRYGDVLAHTHPAEALEWWKAGDSQVSGLVSPLGSLIRWARVDHRAAWDWVKAQPEGSIPGCEPRDFLYQLTFSDAATTLEYSRDLPPGEPRASLISNTLRSLTMQNPAAAVEALFTLTPEDMANFPLSRIAGYVVNEASVRVADALPRWTDAARRDEMTAAVCPPLAKIDRARAEALAAAITDPVLRADVQQKLNSGSK